MSFNGSRFLGSIGTVGAFFFTGGGGGGGVTGLNRSFFSENFQSDFVTFLGPGYIE